MCGPPPPRPGRCLRELGQPLSVLLEREHAHLSRVGSVTLSQGFLGLLPGGASGEEEGELMFQPAGGNDTGLSLQGLGYALTPSLILCVHSGQGSWGL